MSDELSLIGTLGGVRFDQNRVPRAPRLRGVPSRHSPVRRAPYPGPASNNPGSFFPGLWPRCATCAGEGSCCKPARVKLDAERRQVLAVLRRHGWNATSFQVLEPGFRYWFADADACVAYVDTGRAWVAAGSPLTTPERIGEVAEHFRRDASAAGRRLALFGVEQRMVEAVSWPSLLIGEQPEWDADLWPAALRGSSGLREQLRRALGERRHRPDRICREAEPPARPRSVARWRHWWRCGAPA